MARQRGRSRLEVRGWFLEVLPLLTLVQERRQEEGLRNRSEVLAVEVQPVPYGGVVVSSPLARSLAG
jgi:hypothetical protein